MIASLRGTLVRKDGLGVTIECAGVGYGVAMSLNSLSRVGSVGEEAFVFVYTHVTEDSLRLFGFVEESEQAAFLMLLGISGVGPKLALSVLSALSPNDLAVAIRNGDLLRLKKIPGVGAKKAERLLLELKDKWKGMAEPAPVVGSPAALSNDLVSALENLGFAEAVAAHAAEEALAAHPGERDFATLVKVALQRATR